MAPLVRIKGRVGCPNASGTEGSRPMRHAVWNLRLHTIGVIDEIANHGARWRRRASVIADGRDASRGSSQPGIH